MNEPLGTSALGWLRRDGRVYVVLALIASLGLVLAVHASDVLLTHDGPQHVYLGHLGNHFTDPGAVYPKYYEPGHPISALGFSLLFGPLEAAFGWREALRAFCSLTALLWGWGLFALVTSAQGRKSALALVGFGTALPWALYMGFFSFTLATAVGFFTLALALALERWSTKRWLAIAGLLLCQAVFHSFAAAATSLTVAVVVLSSASRRELAGVAGRLALLAVPVGLIGLASAGWMSRFSAQSSAATVHLPAPGFVARLALVPQTFAGGPWWRSLVPIVVCLWGVTSALGRLRRRTLSRRDAALLATSVLFLALALGLPLHTLSWNFLSPRFVPTAVVLGVVLLRDADLGRPKARSALGLAAAVWVAASIGWSARFERGLQGSCADLLAVLKAPLEHHGPRLPIILDSTCGLSPADPFGPMPYLEPAFNIGQLFAVQQGGVVPYTFTQVAAVHPFVLSKRGNALFPPVPERLRWWPVGTDPVLGSSPTARRYAVTHLASYGSHYEDVILWGRPSDGDLLLGLGYDVELRRGGALLARFRGCPLTLDVTAPQPVASIHVEYGWAPVDTAFWKSTVKTRPNAGGAEAHVALPKTPCGKVWVSVRADGGAACRGADARGRLTALTTDSPRLGCVLE